MHYRVNQEVGATISGEEWSICNFMHCSDVGSGIILVSLILLFDGPSLAKPSLRNTVKDTSRRSFSLRIPYLRFSYLPAFGFRPALAPRDAACTGI